MTDPSVKPEPHDLQDRMNKTMEEHALYGRVMRLGELYAEWRGQRRDAEALEAAREAVGVGRSLVRRERALFPASVIEGCFINSLLNLSECLWAAGRHEEALEAAREARGAGHSGIWTLPRLRRILSGLGSHEEALEVAREQVKLARSQVRHDSEDVNSHLAHGLATLGEVLCKLGRYEEALEAVRVSIELFRPVTRNSPGSAEMSLLKGLNQLGGILSKQGRRQEALAPLYEAVEVVRPLSQRDPERFNPAYATLLGNLGKTLNRLGRRQEALETERMLAEVQRLMASSPSAP